VPLSPEDEDRRSNKVRGVDTDQRSNDECEHEPTDRFGSEDEQRDQHNEHSHTGVDGAADTCFQGCICNVRDRFVLTAGCQRFTDAIEDDDRIGDGVTHDAEQRGDEERINLECREVAEDRKDAEQDHDVVNESGDRSETEGPRIEAAWDFAERECKGDREGGSRTEESAEGTVLQWRTNGRSGRGVTQLVELSAGTCQSVG